MFGTVSSVHLPKITRILHLTKSTLNSGFGFVRFASKTAARRFAKVNFGVKNFKKYLFIAIRCQQSLEALQTRSPSQKEASKC